MTALLKTAAGTWLGLQQRCTAAATSVPAAAAAAAAAPPAASAAAEPSAAASASAAAAVGRGEQLQVQRCFDWPTAAQEATRGRRPPQRW